MTHVQLVFLEAVEHACRQLAHQLRGIAFGDVSPGDDTVVTALNQLARLQDDCGDKVYALRKGNIL